MPIFVVFIILSFVFYLFYKVRYFRSKRPAEKQWISAKSKIALGIFVAIFGINQLFLFPTTVSYIVAAVFIVVGGLSIWNGIRMYKFFLPHAIEEAEYIKNQQ
ncbi:YtpI family protein [Cytobacillus purgationiresistens]|uniref:Succinate-acetate transporter protein n=1 Tax=Cytobacillus purgationiresistens TaxID=863449 RepID=A0ABU0AMQ3_9BACI|nr:YtpI family protein [Cytobacillus purgationiresistens]MDQ0272077.1 succinate-acetate transporter protein [Cytobacillus purgationiresistens]